VTAQVLAAPARGGARRGALLVVCAAGAALNLFAGLAGGLARFGVDIATLGAAEHGAIMVCGFFGTLIALERAMALQRKRFFVAPLAAAVGGLLAFGAGATSAAGLVWLVAAGVLAAAYLHAGRTRAWSLPLVVETLAASCWGIGTAAWLGGDRAAALLPWLAFLVLTIAAERRELTRLTALPRAARVAFVALVAVACVAAGLAALGVEPRLARASWWLACGGFAAWLLAFDPAPRALDKPQWPGHTALCLAVGYAWLALAALVGAAGAFGLAPHHVAATAPHVLLLGFVFAMVFGHAPIILPALARLRPAYTPWARLPLGVMAASIVLRIAATAWPIERGLAAAGIGHALAVLLFAGVMVQAVRRGRR
jgi:hypothetical protein